MKRNPLTSIIRILAACLLPISAMTIITNIVQHYHACQLSLRDKLLIFFLLQNHFLFIKLTDPLKLCIKIS